MLFEVEMYRYETLLEQANGMLPEKVVGVYEMSEEVHAVLTME